MTWVQAQPARPVVGLTLGDGALTLRRQDHDLEPVSPQHLHDLDQAVDALIALVGAVDGILQGQARSDADYFCQHVGRPLSEDEQGLVHAGVLKAYRWQYIVSGVMEPRFQKCLFSLVSEPQAARIHAALAPLTYAVPQRPEVPLPMAA